MSRIFCFTAGTVIALLCASAAPAQTTFATITGTVVDSSGAVVPHVNVTATNVETNIKSEAVSNDAGVYTISQLKEGTYTLRAEAAGLRSSSRKMSPWWRATCGASTSSCRLAR